MELSGVLIVDKEKGYTSFDVVAKLRGILGIRKIGHTGTLDPDATGVLVCCIGKATKLIPLMEGADKTYRATMRLGLVTDTQDIWGTELSESSYDDITHEMIKTELESVIGDQMQVPPMYSAKKVGGKKLYELAREGREIERKPVPITVHSVSDVSIDIPEVTFTVKVSKGTYIRTLIHDMGTALGCGACMSELRRITAGKYDIGQAHTLNEIESLMKAGDINKTLLPIDKAFEGMERLTIKPSFEKLLRNGNLLTDNSFENSYEAAEGEEVLVYMPEGTFAAVYTFNNKSFKVKKMFL